MSSRRSQSRQSSNLSRLSEEQINDLILKLQVILPEARVGHNGGISAAMVLQETCSYIRSLQQEFDDLSEQLAELLSMTDSNSAQAAIIRSFVHVMQLDFQQLD